MLHFRVSMRDACLSPLKLFFSAPIEIYIVSSVFYMVTVSLKKLRKACKELKKQFNKFESGVSPSVIERF